MLSRYPTLLFLAAVVAEITADTGCAISYTICSPPGATSSATPLISSPEFENIYNDIIDSSLPDWERSSQHIPQLGLRSQPSLCCKTGLSCLVLANLALPFCYDKFTTDYYLPGGAYGTVSNGSYTTISNDSANLQTGNYTLANGQSGNIYSSNPTLIPNTASLPIPTPYTSSGVGDVVPASGLGRYITLTYTTTLPPSTLPATTISPSTVPPYTSLETDIYPGTYIPTTVSDTVTSTYVASERIRPVTTIPGSTISPTTIKESVVTGVITIVTTMQPATASNASAASASNTRKSSATRRFKGSLVAVVVVCVVFGGVGVLS